MEEKQEAKKVRRIGAEAAIAPPTMPRSVARENPGDRARARLSGRKEVRRCAGQVEFVIAHDRSIRSL